MEAGTSIVIITSISLVLLTGTVITQYQQMQSQATQQQCIINFLAQSNNHTYSGMVIEQFTGCIKRTKGT